MSDAAIIVLFSAYTTAFACMLVWIKSISAALDRANLRNDKAEDRHRADIAVVRAEGKVTADAFNISRGENNKLNERVKELADGKENDKAAFAVSSTAYERKIAELEKANAGLQETISKYEQKFAGMTNEIVGLKDRVAVLEGQKAALVNVVQDEPAKLGTVDAIVNAGEGHEVDSQ